MDKAALPPVERQRDLSITSGCAHAFLLILIQLFVWGRINYWPLTSHTKTTTSVSYVSNQLHATSLTMCESHKWVELTARENANVLENTSVFWMEFTNKSMPELGVCAGRIGRVKANISIQSAISGLEKFQSATNPPKSKSGGLVTNFGGFNLAGYAG